MIYLIGAWRYLLLVNYELCAKFYGHFKGIQRGERDTKERHLRNWYHLKDTLLRYQSIE